MSSISTIYCSTVTAVHVSNLLIISPLRQETLELFLKQANIAMIALKAYLNIVAVRIELGLRGSEASTHDESDSSKPIGS